MLLYTSILNSIGTYWDLLELNRIIQTYQRMMIYNIDDKETYENLKKACNFYQQEKKKILGNNKIDSIREDILSKQDFILSCLFDDINLIEIRYFSKIGNRKLPLYAIFQEIVKYDILFFDIYRILIQNNLYNPNLEYGVSDEPFFALLPTSPINLFYPLNQMVISNFRTDFHILKNGSDIIKYALYSLSNSENEMVENYWRDYIMNAIMGNCSLLDSRRYHGIVNYEVKPNIFEIMENPKLKTIQLYLVSQNGVNKQLENSLYPSLERDEAIEFYIKK